VFFVVHGILPMIQIPKRFNLDATCELLREAKDYAENRKNI